MERDPKRYKHSEITEVIIGSFYKVYNAIGFGFVEKAYENALVTELEINGLTAYQQKEVAIEYKGSLVGSFIPDVVVEDRVIVELKATDKILPSHEKQLLNYLKVTAYEVGLILNFGPKPQVVRKAYDNANKPWLFRK